MKIYPSTHNLIITDKINKDTDIPLAFIDTDNFSYIVKKSSNISFLEEPKVLIPYEEVKDLNSTFFKKIDNNSNSTYEEISKHNNADILQRTLNGKYQYIPKSSISFQPDRFDFYVLGKKRLQYDSSKLYNLTVSCVDHPDYYTLAKNLIKVFGDAPKRKICPANISINNQDTSLYNFTSGDIINKDFVFIETENGVDYKNYGTEEALKIDKEIYLNNNTNIWITSETNSTLKIKESKTKKSFNLKKNLAIKTTEMSSYYYFDINDFSNTQDITVHNIFSETQIPILILEHKNKAFEIISHSSFLENIETNKDVFYEALLYVFFNSYKRSNTINQWITNEMPDYIVINNSLVSKDTYVHNYKITDLFNLKSHEIILSKVVIMPEKQDVKIDFTGLYNDYITFEKTSSSKKDEIKPTGYQSIFTPRQNIIYFKDSVYKVEDNINEKIDVIINNNIINVNLDYFKHTSLGINSLPLTFKADFRLNSEEEMKLYLYSKNNVITMEKVQNDTEYGTLLTVITIQKDNSNDNISILHDMRKRGGGLAKDQEPNYNLLDIGHIYGRPYRKAGSLIVTVPKRLEPYKERIALALKNHAIAEDMIIILFE